MRCPPLGRRCPGRDGRWSSARGGCRWRRPGRRAGTAPRRRGPAAAGWRVMTTVVRPRRACARRPAIRDSVWASTALVGSTSTSVSASVSSARARARRWRWPPEKDRPRSSTSLSSPAGSASRMSSPLATDSASSSASSSWTPDGSSSSRSTPVNSRGSFSLTTTRRRTAASGRSASGTPSSRTGVRSGPNRPSRSARAADSSGRARDHGGQPAGCHRDVADRVGQRAPLGRLGRRDGGVRGVGLHLQHPDDLARADVGAGGAVGELGGGAQRDDEERRVAVEGHELARGDPAVQGEAGAEPGDEHDEDAGQQHLGRVQRRPGSRPPGCPRRAPAGTAPRSGAGRSARRRCRAARAGRRPCRRRGWSAGPTPRAARPGGAAADAGSATGCRRAAARRPARPGRAASRRRAAGRRRRRS